MTVIKINIFGGGIAEAKNEFFETKCRKILKIIILLYGFSVACEGEDKFAVACEGKLRQIHPNK
jgi:hypothetical protein